MSSHWPVLSRGGSSSFVARGQPCGPGCDLSPQQRSEKVPVAFSQEEVPWPCLTHGLCVPPLAGGSGIHRPVAKKTIPGAEYKAKVRAGGRGRAPLVGALGQNAHHHPKGTFCGASMRPHLGAHRCLVVQASDGWPSGGAGALGCHLRQRMTGREDTACHNRGKGGKGNPHSRLTLFLW